jgi:hypothetical protein
MHIAELLPVAVQAVVALGIVGQMVALVVGLVAGVRGAIHQVVAVDRGSVQATGLGVAGLLAVAIHRVVTVGIVGHELAGITGLIAAIVRAVHRVVTGNRTAGYARTGLAGFRPVAVKPIVAVAVRGTGAAHASLLRIAHLPGRAGIVVGIVPAGIGVLVAGSSSQASTVQSMSSSQETTVPGVHFS